MTEQNEPELLETGNTNAEDKDGEADDNREAEPAHHARRPMNAFLIFCKRHRSVVREKYPNLENRSITKILGEWWANLEDDEKASYTGLAKLYKDAFFTANPDFKWYKLPAPPLRTLSTRPTNIFANMTPDYTPSNIKSEPADGDDEKTNNNSTKIDYNRKVALMAQVDGSSSTIFTPGKLADVAQMGGLSSLMTTFDNRNLSPETQKTALLEAATQISLPCTPKCQNMSSNNDTPRPPRKRIIAELNTETSNKYFKEESIQSQVTSKTEPQIEDDIKELQNALSETSRILEKAFEAEDDSWKRDYKASTVDNSKNGDRLDEGTEDQMRNDLTQQEIIDRVVSKKLTDYKEEADLSSNSTELNRLSWEIDYAKDSKSSVRSCKGKRYQEFMAFGGLYINKRQKRDYNDTKSLQLFDRSIKLEEDISPSCSWKSIDMHDRSTGTSTRSYDSEQDDLHETEKVEEHCSTHEGDSCESNNKMFKASDFDLDAKIRALPSLSFEKFHQKKKENKKRKSNLNTKAKDFNSHRYERPHDTHVLHRISQAQGDIFCSENKVYIPQSVSHGALSHHSNNNGNNSHNRENAEVEQARSAIIGSKKRKPRKVSITRLDVNISNKTNTLNREQHFGTAQTEYTTSILSNVIHPPALTPAESGIDLCALETLAEVAANTSKIDENN